MLDPKLLRENPEAVKEATRVKRVGSPELVDAWVAADQRRRSSQTQADAIKAKFTHGVLEVSIPKQPVVPAKRVAVEH